MFIIKNLRKEQNDEWVYLKCDFDVTEIDNPFEEKTIWMGVKKENEDMLSDNVYDPFVLVPLMMGMYYHQDVKIEGSISPRFYHNIKHYLMKIFDNFSDKTKTVNFEVNGFDTVKQYRGGLIGTGISCGVDNLTTIYDNFINEDDPNFKINALFFVNTGTHGDYENVSTKERFLDRAKMNSLAAKELGLPMYLIDTNFHAFTHKVGEQIVGHLAIYSCFIGLQKYIHRYYISSCGLSYDEIADYRKYSRDFDIAEYCEDYMLHLISTENFELVSDGCQYTRIEKEERIANWPFAWKYLNVCVTPVDHGKNCSCCSKCMRTLIPLDTMGKIDNFKDVFDLDIYRKNATKWKTKFSSVYGKSVMETDIVDYCSKKGVSFVPTPIAKIAILANKVRKKIIGK